MAERKKRPKMVFRKFLDDNQKILKEFGNSKAEKYIREPWMMKACPTTDKTDGALQEEADSFLYF